MTRILAAALLALAAGRAPAQSIEREIANLEHQIAQAIVKNDAAFVASVFADDFYYTGVRGEIKKKSDIVNELKSGDLKFELLQFDDIKVRHQGDTAIVTGLAITKGTSPQGPISGQFRYTRVYVKRQSAWQLILFQGTPVATPPPAASPPG
jgi:uncharacterized protein (TIGR02246 family)